MENVEARYAQQERFLRDEIEKLNREFGLTDHRITFGYIGNCGFNGENDDRLWMVFLPHPGRIGTTDDSIGGFRTGSLEGILATRKALSAFAQGARFARSAALWK